jgi:glycosyltransferase involved in cell wall biosynthesis
MLSVVIPIRDEASSIPELISRLDTALSSTGRAYEVIFVNDGSVDGSGQILRKHCALDPHLKAIHLHRSQGQTAAMMAGFDYASGSVIVGIDGDLQNDPADIPVLISKLDEGFDLVSGWRRDRRDHPIRRNLLSRIANGLISWTTGVHLHDYGCSLKAYRREVLNGVRLYG